MVGAKTRASLTSELRRPVPRRARRGLQTKERPMSSYPVQRPLPPARRPCSEERLVPQGTWLNAAGWMSPTRLNQNSWPTKIRAVSISSPELRSSPYSVTNVAESGSPASSSMASSSVEGASLRSEARVLGLRQYISALLSPEDITNVPSGAKAKREDPSSSH